MKDDVRIVVVDIMNGEINVVFDVNMEQVKYVVNQVYFFVCYVI